MTTEPRTPPLDTPWSSPEPAGIYVHVPFCRAKCPYCDFYSVTRLTAIDAYVDAVLAEIAMCRQTVACADSIYLGGGTPSLLTPGQVGRILDAVAGQVPLAPDMEVTLEVNPGTADPDALRAYRLAGVNRLTIGLQSLEDDALRQLGRIHTARQGRRTYDWARKAGFDNLGVDLIYARPGQTRDDWRSEMDRVIDLGPEHVSCYSLTLEPGTPMARKAFLGKIVPLDEGTSGDLFDLTIDHLGGHDYRQYEISNFARRGAEATVDLRSRHNRKYWTFAPFLGVGPSAHSFRNDTRWWNHRSLDRYLADVDAGQPPVAERETLSREQQIMECVFLGLRQVEGIDTTCFADRFNEDFATRFESSLTRLADAGLLEHVPGRVRLTRRGMRLMDRVVEEILGDG